MSNNTEKSELFSKISHIIRVSALVAIMAVLAFVCVIRLLQIQIVDAGKYRRQEGDTITATQMIQAVRGQIADSEGRPLNTNRNVYKLVAQYAFLPRNQENEVIALALEILQKHDHEWLDSMPITLEKSPLTGEYQFMNVPEEELDKFKRRIGVNYDATVENCLKAVASNYGIDAEKYDDEYIRCIGGVRYEMEVRDFSFRNRYVMAEDISMDAMIELREKARLLRGLEIIAEPVREYLDGTAVPHIRGRISAISDEQYQALREDGYNLNDFIGLYGIEQSMEHLLRGENGELQITRDETWEVVSLETIKEPLAGNSIKLTIDTEFQRTIEEVLANHIKWINQPGNNRSRHKTETTSGSIVVLDVTTGAILAMANNPSYDVNDYIDLLLAEVAGESPIPYNPLLDRSAAQGYRPGSTFKTVTGTAGLIHEVVGRNESIRCAGRYYRFSNYRPRCWGTHGSIASVRAMRQSCNVYYYEVGYRLGIERLADIALQFGVGTDLNCDIYNFPGRMTTPEIYESLLGVPISDGDVVQAAIGQSENLLTPLHMATIAMTVANNGIRYRPYLVDSVWNYDFSELISKTEPQIVADLSRYELSAMAFESVQAGMYDLANSHRSLLFTHLPHLPAFKTGTPEIIPQVRYNSAVLGYYPYENPKIAFAVILEGGDEAYRLTRNIIDAYFYGYDPDIREDGSIGRFHKPWTGPKTPIPGRYNDEPVPAAA